MNLDQGISFQAKTAENLVQIMSGHEFKRSVIEPVSLSVSRNDEKRAVPVERR